MQLADFPTLAAAKAYSTTEGRLIPRTTMNSILGDTGLMLAFEAEALTDDRFAAFMHPTSVEYNFIQGNPTGDKQISMLDAIIAEGKFPALADLKPVVIALANRTYYPHANATEYDFQRAKGTLPRVAKTPESGWLKITTTADCEPHRPQIHAEIQGVMRRVAGFDTVSAAGDYITQVPAGYATLHVDDAYGVIA